MSQVDNLQKFPSMASVISTATTILPPGFVAKKPKPEKPFGPSMLTLMNRTSFGPGQRFCNYAFICLGLSILFIAAGSTYLGLRNVSRMIVFRTEFLGPFCIIMSILLIGLAARLFYEARMQSNRWRAGIKFRPSGMNTVVPYNTNDPEEELIKDLQSGTFTDKAMKEIPRPGRGRGRSRFASVQSLKAARSFGSRLDNRPPDIPGAEKLGTVDEGRYSPAPMPPRGVPTTGPTGRMPLRPPFQPGLPGLPPMVGQRPPRMGPGPSMMPPMMRPYPPGMERPPGFGPRPGLGPVPPRGPFGPPHPYLGEGPPRRMLFQPQPRHIQPGITLPKESESEL